MDRAHAPLGPLLKRDRELEVGALAHFEDAAYYAATYDKRTGDAAYYRALAEGAASVLEYGIGNGRIALPIARDGIEVFGIDHSRPMLEDLARRLRSEAPDVRKRVHSKRGDMRRVQLRRRFPLVTCPFNTALHLYDRHDVEQWLARVDEHLEPSGKLVFDVTMPMLDDLARDPSRGYATRPFVHPSLGKVKYREFFDYDRVRQILFVSMCFEPQGGHKRDETVMTPLAHRQFFPRELEALLHYNGFDVTAMLGDFDGSELGPESDVMIVHAKKQRASRRRR